MSSVSQATCRPHRCACSRTSGSRTWAAMSSRRVANGLRGPRVRRVPSAPRERRPGSRPAGRAHPTRSPARSPRPRTARRARPARHMPSSGRAPLPDALASRRRWCGPVRRRAGPAACPARRRRVRPTAAPSTARSSASRSPSARHDRRRLVVEPRPRPLPDRPRGQRRHGRGDHVGGRPDVTTPHPRFARVPLHRSGPQQLSRPRRAPAAWPRPSRRCSRWTSRRCVSPTTSARIISRQYQRWPSLIPTFLELDREAARRSLRRVPPAPDRERGGPAPARR